MNRKTMKKRTIERTVRGTAEHVGGARIRYTWPCGHAQVKDHTKGPIHRRFGELAAKFYVRYWSGSNGVNLPPCRKCKVDL